MRGYNHPKIEFSLIGLVLCLVFYMAGSAKADFTFGTPTKLGPMVNSWSDDYSPCLSADGLSLYFASTRLGGLGNYDLWVSTRETTSDDWGSAESLGSVINSPDEDVSPAVSPDGLELYFTSFRADGQGGADIWVARRQTTTESWSEPENLGSLVNSAAHEVTPSLSADGLELYFTSGQENGEPRSSLYVTQRDTIDAPWSAPVRLDPAINSETCQWNPTISYDGLLLFFTDYWNSAARPDGVGATDIWLTMRANKDSEWIAPVNLGQPTNTSFIEDSPMISPDGSTLYFSSDAYDEPAGWNNLDIWEVPIVPVADLDDDGYVGLNDVLKLAESWGLNDPLCDIAPVAWGDGVVNVTDLDALVDHWFPADTGLTAHWTFDEVDGSIAHDSAGAYDANVVGDPVWLPDGGMAGGALQFDGDGDYVSAPYVLPSGSKSFSIFAWIKGGAPNQVILSESGMYGDFVLQADFIAGNLMTSLYCGIDNYLFSEAPIIDGQWHHVGLVWNNDALSRTLYVDDVEVASDITSASGGLGRTGLYIGASWGLDTHKDYYWDGLIDDVQIYERAVTSQARPQTFRRPTGQKGL
ncbi:LamG-like jellyroll fold domain-containing protein [Planctomycetota bacterium]